MIGGLGGNNFGVSFNLHPSLVKPGADAEAGQGQKVAQAFQEAKFLTDGYEAQYDTSKLGLEQVANNGRSTQREKLVAQVVLHQSEIAQEANAVRKSRDGFSSKSLLVGMGLSLIAAGQATTGPIGAVLAEVGTRQMDDLRAQGWGQSSPADLHDANVAGKAMLEAIKLHGGDEQAQKLAADALSHLEGSYKKAPKEGDLYVQEKTMYQDASVIYGAFNDIKTVTCQGDASNPKCMAFLEGDLPGTGLTSSLGRPGGKVGMMGSNSSFSVEKDAQPWDH